MVSKSFYLTSDEREIIERMLKENHSVALISIVIGRSLRTVKLELSKNGYPQIEYKAHHAQKYADKMCRYQKRWLYRTKSSILKNFHYD